MTYSISSEEEYVADNPGQVPREVVCTAFDENNAVMCFLDGIRFISEIWSLKTSMVMQLQALMQYAVRGNEGIDGDI